MSLVCASISRAHHRTLRLLEHLNFTDQVSSQNRARSARLTPAGISSKTKSDQEVPALPIFVLQPSLPTCEERLHIFEPRYRLMIKHCLEQEGPAGQMGEFGMCWSVPGGSFSEVGTLLRVQEHITLPDGRLEVRCIAVRRFHVLQQGEISGVESSTDTEASYNTARVEWFDDEEEHSLPTEADSKADAMAGEARGLLAELHDTLLRAYPVAEARWLLLKIHGPEAYEKLTASLDASKSVNVTINAPDDNCEFAWWVLSQLVPLPPDVKATLVVSQSVSERMAHAIQLLESLCEALEAKAPGEMSLVEVDEDST